MANSGYGGSGIYDVRCEKVLDELMKIRKELEAENGIPDPAE